MVTTATLEEPTFEGVGFPESEGPGVVAPQVEMPYGTTSSGAARRKPGRKPGQRNGTGKAASSSPATPVAPGPPAPPRRPSTGGRPPSRSSIDYRAGLLGIAQLFATPLGLAGAKKPVLALDAAAITMHAPPIAGAINETAKHDQRLAALLDKILTLGPYGLVIGAAIPFVAQICSNHGWIPEQMAKGMGAYSRDELTAMLSGSGEPS